MLQGPIRVIDWHFRFRGRHIHKYCHFFLFESPEGEPRPQAGRGHHRLPVARARGGARALSYDNARGVLKRAGEMVRTLVAVGAGRSRPPAERPGTGLTVAAIAAAAREPRRPARAAAHAAQGRPRSRDLPHAGRAAPAARAPAGRRGRPRARRRRGCPSSPRSRRAFPGFPVVAYGAVPSRRRRAAARLPAPRGGRRGGRGRRRSDRGRHGRCAARSRAERRRALADAPRMLRLTEPLQQARVGPAAWARSSGRSARARSPGGSR